MWAMGLVQAKATFVKKVSDVLRAPEIDKIDFFLEKDFLEVSPRRLKAVGDAIEKGRIDLAIDGTGSLLSAAYSPHANKMTVGDWQVADRPVGRSGIVHESTHALVDLFECKQATTLSDEAAAYLAETIFLRATKTWVKGDAKAMAIYNAADKLVKQYGLGQGKQVRLKWEQYAPLREAVRGHPAYSGIDTKELTSGHGVP
jgi:hypothetical protein